MKLLTLFFLGLIGLTVHAEPQTGEIILPDGKVSCRCGIETNGKRG